MKSILKVIWYWQFTAILLTVAAVSAAGIKELPFHGSILAVEISVPAPPVRFVDATGSGNATHLGRFTVTYEFVIELATRAGIGCAHFIAANGDSLFTESVGQGNFTANPDVPFVVETHTITGGTSRFAGATGSFTRERFISLAGNYLWLVRRQHFLLIPCDEGQLVENHWPTGNVIIAG